MIYTLYAPSNAMPLGDQTEAMVAIPETKAYWALIAPLFWLAWHRLWFWLAIYALISACLTVLLATPMWPLVLVGGFIQGLYLWLEGNQLRRHALERQGYVLVGVVDAPDGDIAVARGVDAIVKSKLRTLGMPAASETVVLS